MYQGLNILVTNIITAAHQHDILIHRKGTPLSCFLIRVYVICCIFFEMEISNTCNIAISSYHVNTNFKYTDP